MAFKTMSQREQRRAKRRLRQLEDLVRGGRYETERTALRTWTGLSQLLRQEVSTARALGYRIEVTLAGDDGIALTAVKDTGGWKKLQEMSA